MKAWATLPDKRALNTIVPIYRYLLKAEETCSGSGKR